MPRTITVKGIGKVSAAPDYVVLSMGLESQDMDYEKAMNIASENIDNLNAALEQVGFEKKSVKTTNFNVHTDYEYRRRKDGSNERVFNGYKKVQKRLKSTHQRAPKEDSMAMS